MSLVIEKELRDQIKYLEETVKSLMNALEKSRPGQSKYVTQTDISDNNHPQRSVTPEILQRKVSPMRYQVSPSGGPPSRSRSPYSVGYRVPPRLTCSDSPELSEQSLPPNSEVRQSLMKDLKRFGDIDICLQNHVIDLELKNKSLKKELETVKRDFRRNISEYEHQRLILMKQISEMEEAIVILGQKITSLESELATSRLRHRDTQMQLKRATNLNHR
eukprot:Tbor_TRINITY_DN4879_c0_g1::TRINITY_DN4879_c0_g1_i3::g.1495::m.1495